MAILTMSTSSEPCGLMPYTVETVMILFMVLRVETKFKVVMAQTESSEMLAMITSLVTPIRISFPVALEMTL